MGRLDGKVVLISGGARGQGAAEARMFAAEGACVVIGDILDDAGRRVAAEIRQTGGRATYVHLDVTAASDWAAAVDAAVAAYGRLNVLVNNAGIMLWAGIEKTTAAEWDRVFAVNAKGVFLGTRAALPALRAAGGGSIVNISSIDGIVGQPFGLAAYGSSKAAVRLFTKSTALQYAKEGIRCNSVHSGPVETEMLQAMIRSGAGRILGGILKAVAALRRQPIRLPRGRAARPEEIAYAVLYLASDESSFVTGTELVVDGGRTAR